MPICDGGFLSESELQGGCDGNGGKSCVDTSGSGAVGAARGQTMQAPGCESSNMTMAEIISMNGGAKRHVCLMAKR